MEWEKYFQSRKIQLIIIVLCTALLYVNILPNELVWDDHAFIEEWQEGKEFNFKLFFLGNVPMGHGGVYRPMRSIFYAISYSIWQGNPIGYHIQSIVIHLLATILVYLIFLSITKNKIIGFVGGLVFGVHPIHTEAITSITASFDTLGLVFFLASFYFYLNKQWKFWELYSLLFAFLAFFTYELTIILPLVIILYDYIFKNEIKFTKYLNYIFIAVFYLFVRIFLLRIINREEYLGGSIFYTFITMTKAIGKYIFLMVFPNNLTIDHKISEGIYSFVAEADNSLIIAQSIFDPGFIIGIFSIAILFYIAIRADKIISFSILFFFVSLLPVLNIFPGSMILAEKYLYISSIGFSLIVGYFFNKFYKIKKYRKISLCGIIIILMLFSVKTIDRNRDFQNDYTLFSSAVEISPSPVALNLVGSYYHGEGDLDAAIEFYEKSAKNEAYALAQYNLGVAYRENGNLDEAIKSFEKTIKLQNDYVKAFNNLGMIYMETGFINEALESFLNAIDLNPNYIDAHYNLGVAYFQIGEFDLAISKFTDVINMDHSHNRVHYNLGTSYYLKQNPELLILAIQELEKAIIIDPNFAQAYNNLGLAYYANGESNKARASLNRAIEIDTNYEEAKKNLELVNEEIN